MPGIEDVARLAGVSTATVSRALSGRGQVAPATRDLVEGAAASLGYVVQSAASALASGRTRNVGVLVPLLDRWFYSTVLSGVTAVLGDQGYDVTLYNLTTDAAERRRIFDTFLRRQRVDGVITIALAPSTRERRRLRELGIPVVEIGDAPGPSSVTVDDEAVGYIATRRLLDLGHTAIGHIGAQAHVRGTAPAARRHGWERALDEAGLPVRADLFVGGDFTVAGGHRAARELLPRATAIFAASDEMAVGALLAAREAGRSVPGEMSIIGVDGYDLAEFFGIDTVDQFPLQQGRRAAGLILESLGEAVEPAVLPPFRLLSRGSAAPV